jgi:uncharacterized membrane protein AbrB (regulator of aidB expression)
MAVYLALGLTNPVADELLHEQVSADVRTTVLSVRSMTLQGAGMAAGVSLGALADSWGIPAAWILTALVLGATSVFYLHVDLAQPSRRDGRAIDAETSVLPLG